MAVTAVVPSTRFLGQQLLPESAPALPLPFNQLSMSPSPSLRPIRNAVSRAKTSKNRVVRTPAIAQKVATLTASAAHLSHRPHPPASFHQILPLPSRLDRSILESQWALTLSDPLPEIVTAEINRLRDLYFRPSPPRPLFISTPLHPVRVKGGGPARQRRIQARQVQLSAIPAPTDPSLLSLKRSDQKRQTSARAGGAGQELGSGVLGSYLNSTGGVKLLTKEEEILLSTKLQSTLMLWDARSR